MLNNYIVGAGLSGCIAAALDRRAVVFEAESTPRGHKALLRFRTDRIGHALNIPFRRVRVTKAIELYNQLHPTSDPRMLNLYSLKVSGRVLPRSIEDLNPGERFIAPENFHEQLLDILDGRVHYDHPYKSSIPRPLISTIPLPTLLNELGIESLVPMERAPIHVMRARIDRCDTYQSIYHVTPGQGIYRSSITGNLLIIESMTEIDEDEALNICADAYGLPMAMFTATETVEQKFGKIVPLPDDDRKALLLRLTEQHGIFSLGRFATWRNILLDDVMDDYYKIRDLMKLGNYDVKRRMA